MVTGRYKAVWQLADEHQTAACSGAGSTILTMQPERKIVCTFVGALISVVCIQVGHCDASGDVRGCFFLAGLCKLK